MSMILRYAKHLRRISNDGLRVKFNQYQVKVTGIKFGPHQFQSAQSNSTISYATEAASAYRSNDVNIRSLLNTLAEDRNSKRGLVKSNLEKIVHLLETSRSISSLDALLVIRSCGQSLIDSTPMESVKLAHQMWDICKRNNIPLDISHYNALLNVYLEKEYEFTPSKFLLMMQENSIEPNHITYQRLILAYCRRGDIASATKILEIMKENNIPLNEDVFNSLIIGHSEANDLKHAIEIFETMKQNKINPSADTYEALLCAYAKHGKIDEVKNTLEEMEKSEIYLLNTELIEVIYTLVANGHVEVAEELTDTLLKPIQSDIDVVRIAIKFLHIQQLPLAMKILEVTSKNQLREKIRQSLLVKFAVRSSNLSEKSIVDLCNYLSKKNNEINVFQSGLFHMFQSDVKPNVAVSMLNAWRENGGEIRTHYFWPILKSEAKQNNLNGIINILQIMITDFKLIPTTETLCDYVLPNMYGSWDDIIQTLKSFNIPYETIVIAIAEHLMNDKQIDKAITFMCTHEIKYPKERFLRPLARSYVHYGDPHLFITALRLLDCEPKSENNTKTPIELVDAGVLEVMKVIPSYRRDIIISLLHSLINSGLSISPEVGEQIELFLKENYQQSQISKELEILEKLTSGTSTQTSLVDLRNERKNINNSGQWHYTSSSAAELRRDFSMHLEQKNTQGILNTLNNMEKINFVSAPIYAQAIDFFCKTENLEAAEKYVNAIKNVPFAKLDNIKIIRFAALLVKNNRFLDAITIINARSNIEGNEHMTHIMRREAKDLLDVIADTKNVENLQQMFDLLKSKNFLEIKNSTLSPLVRVHILRNEINKALELLEHFWITYKLCPFKNKMMQIFIENEDVDSLQKLTNLCTQFHGENNALIELAFVFLEKNRINQVRKIFSSSTIFLTKSKISSIIDHYAITKNINVLEQLPKVIIDISNVNHSYVFEKMAEVYNEMDDWERGSQLWIDMQENDVQPTKKFLQELETLLKRNNQIVPFSDIKDSIIPNDVDNSNATAFYETKENVKFNEAIQKGDYDLAEKLLVESPNQFELCKSYEKLIKHLLNDEKFDSAIRLTKTIIQEYTSTSFEIINYLCKKLMDSERFDDIKQLDKLISQNSPKYFVFKEIFTSAYINTFGLKPYIEYIISNELHPDNVHYSTLLNNLLINPDCESTIVEWAEKMSQFNKVHPMHILWSYYFITDSPLEKHLWDKFITESASPMIRPLLLYAIGQKNPELLERLHTQFENHPKALFNIRLIIMEKLIKIYNDLGRYEDGLKVYNLIKSTSKSFRLAHQIENDLKIGLRQHKITTFTNSKDSFARKSENDEEPTKIENVII